jgi:hypothetical protein
VTSPLRTISGVQGVHRQSTRALAALLALLGLAMVVSALVRGGGPLSVGVVVGAALALFGLGRLVLSGLGRGTGDAPGERAGVAESGGPPSPGR